MHNPESVLENKTYNFLWDFYIQMDHTISARRPDQVIINNNHNKKKKKKKKEKKKKRKKEEDLPNSRLCRPGRPQSKIKRKWKER